MIRVSNIKVTIDYRLQVLQPLLRRLGLPQDQVVNYHIYKESVDARQSSMVYFVYTVDVHLKDQAAAWRRLQGAPGISITPDLDYHPVSVGSESLPGRPVIVGTGPAGLFAGLLLAEMGYRPLLLERGGDVDERAVAVESFWQGGQLDPENNVQFGEGGAGTFSDGKLTTLTKDPRGRKVLLDLVKAGAPEEIVFAQKPHVGTDRLRSVVRQLRERIIKLGGEFRWHAQVTDLLIEQQQVSGSQTASRLVTGSQTDSRFVTGSQTVSRPVTGSQTDSRFVTGVIVNGSERLAAGIVVLAIGHSARDTFAMLHAAGIPMEPKPFSVGLRIEHPQTMIDRVQYKQFAGHKKLGAADYKLVYHSPSGRSAYTFCMCPGGEVVAAASEAGCLCTNGMSLLARDQKNANSALLVGVSPDDFGSDHPLAGVEFQRRLERQAFALGGSNYHAPVQLVGDFLAGKASTEIGLVHPSYRPGVVPSDLSQCLPEEVVQTLREAIVDFGRKLGGFDRPDAVLTGVETRSSSPVRILRDEQCLSSIAGLYPCGEGAGYAGGIVSAAVDGLRVGEAIASRYQPQQIKD